LIIAKYESILQGEQGNVTSQEMELWVTLGGFCGQWNGYGRINRSVDWGFVYPQMAQIALTDFADFSLFPLCSEPLLAKKLRTHVRLDVLLSVFWDAGLANLRKIPHIMGKR